MIVFFFIVCFSDQLASGSKGVESLLQTFSSNLITSNSDSEDWLLVDVDNKLVKYLGFCSMKRIVLLHQRMLVHRRVTHPH